MGTAPPCSLTTSQTAWTVTIDDRYCKRHDSYPMSDMQWALAATSHAHHYTHIDADGFATFVAPQSGLKYWVAGRSKLGESKYFSGTDMYTQRDFAIDEANTHLWDLEGILLNPGTCL